MSLKLTLGQAVRRAIGNAVRDALLEPAARRRRQRYATAFPCLQPNDPVSAEDAAAAGCTPTIAKALAGDRDAADLVSLTNPPLAEEWLTGSDTFVVTDLDERVGELRRTHRVEVVKKYTPKDGEH